MLNKKPHSCLQTSNNNLKNIINETRVPLSKYIHKKIVAVDKNMSYLDKLKCMLTNNQKMYPSTNTSYYQISINKQPNTISHQISNNSPMFPQIMAQNPVKLLPKHKKTQSNLTNPPITMITQNLRISQRRITQKSLLSEIKTTTQMAALKKRVVSTAIGSFENVGRDRNKCQIVNYNKYLPVPQIRDEETEKQKCAKWGRMQLKNVLGSGANASVRVGICNQMKFAVKIYQKYKLIQPRKKKRVYSQIQLLKSIPEHPNIITLYECFQNNRQIHVILQHITSSITLHQHFRSYLLVLQPSQLRLIFGKIVRGVHHLHQHGIAHRDLKPDNILISFQQQQQQVIVKIIDFGFAIQAEQDGLHCGTPNFMAPQLLQKGGKYNTMAVDVWALGVMLFYLAQGRYPFKGYDQKDLYKSIRQGNFQFKKIENPQMKQIIKQMLQHNPFSRITIKQLMQRQYLLNI